MLRSFAQFAATYLFFLLAIVMMPFALGPEPEILGRLAPGLIWLAALLASLLGFGQIFAADREDGTLDLVLLSPVPLPWLVLCRVAASWIVMVGPLLLFAPLAAVLLRLPMQALPVLMAGLATGSVALTMLGTGAAALTLGARHGAMLVALLVAPLYIPALIFGVSAADAAVLGNDYAAHLLLLAGMSVALLSLGPFAIAGMLRQAGS